MKKLICAPGSLTHISIPDTVTEIGYAAFYGCTGLRAADISVCTRLTAIGGYAFYGCTGLTNIDFSVCTNLTEIGAWAFYGCTGLAEVRFPESLTRIGQEAFENISPDVQFTIPTEAVEKLLKDSIDAPELLR